VVDVIWSPSKDGYLKRSSIRSYKASGEQEIGLKENDCVIGIHPVNTHDTLLLFTNKGNYIYLPVFKAPELKWKEIGKHISNVII